MKIHDTIAQGSPEWLQIRAGKITASEADAILTPLFAEKESKAVDTYLGRKLAERWMGQPIMDDKFSSAPVEFGEILEKENRSMFSLMTGLDVKQIGFIESDDGLCGCSPDGLTSDGAGLEIKSPLIQTHCKYLMAGIVPQDYIVQVHFSMFITGYPHWWFMSSRRCMPPMIIKVERDEKVISAIGEAVDSFTEKLHFGWAKLVRLNGGEPKRVNLADHDEETEPQPESTDVPH